MTIPPIKVVVNDSLPPEVVAVLVSPGDEPIERRVVFLVDSTANTNPARPARGG